MPIYTNIRQMLRCRFRFSVFFMAILLLLPTYGHTQKVSDTQKKKQLENQMKQLKKDIALMEKTIKATEQKKKLTQKEINEIRSQISQKEKKIMAFKREADAIGKDIKHTEDEIDFRAVRLNMLKEKYSFVLKQVYKNITDIGSDWYLKGNRSFVEQNYLNRIAEYRKKQAKTIMQNIEALESKKAELEENRKTTEAQLLVQSGEQNKLKSDEQKKTKEVAQLTEKEKKTKEQIVKKNNAAAKLNKAIQKIIEKEIRIAREKAAALAAKNKEKTATSGKTTSAEVYLTPKEMELSKDFSSNQGSLPWPVQKGVIVGKFGRHAHPTIKDIFIENNGIDLKTSPGATARAIFDGTVVTIFNLPTTQNCIMVKHGAYYSVYSNIIDPIVKVGDAVSAKQSLGNIYTDPTDNATKLHLEIWNGKDKLNPATWLVKGD